MGERALAAVFGTETVYWYRSQWGGGEESVADVLTTEAPLEKLAEAEWRFLGTTSLSEANRPIDTLTTDICYLVHPDCVEVYVSLWFGLGLPTTSASNTRGILVPVDSIEGVRRCRWAVREFKGRILDYVAEQRIHPEIASSILKQAIALVQRLIFQFHSVPNSYIPML